MLTGIIIGFLGAVVVAVIFPGAFHVMHDLAASVIERLRS